MPANLLTAKFCSAVTVPGKHRDGDGLELRVSPTFSKSWVLRVRFRGRRPEIGLGSFPNVSLADARDKARKVREAARDGRDPRMALKPQGVAHRGAVTFRQAAHEFIDIKSPEWRNDKHAQQWSNTLATYAFPVIGDVPVAGISLEHVEQILRPIWLTKTETASRVRSRIENVLSYAAVRGYCDREAFNPAQWRGNLEHVFPAKGKVHKVRHHAAMPYKQVPVFMTELRQKSSLSAKALELAVLTTSRDNMICGARSAEFDGDLWTVPGERMKNGKEHRIPLGPRALELLASIEYEIDGFIFPGARGGFSNNALRQFLQKVMGQPYTPHGFRSSFKDWAVETTDYAGDISEAQLAHTIPNSTQAAYERGDKLQKRRELMLAWEVYCGGA